MIVDPAFPTENAKKKTETENRKKVLKLFENLKKKKHTLNEEAWFILRPYNLGLYEGSY